MITEDLPRLAEEPHTSGDQEVYSIEVNYQDRLAGFAFLKSHVSPNYGLPDYLQGSLNLIGPSVEPEFRRRGYGKLLLERAVEYANRTNTQIVTKAISIEEDVISVKELTEFYKQYGFKQDPKDPKSKFLVYTPVGLPEEVLV